jgi:hypothetical protein
MADLERELRDAADHVDWSRGAVVADAVVARLRTGPVSIDTGRRRWLVPALAATAAAALVVVGAVLAERDRPAARHVASPTTTAVPDELGAIVSLQQARSAAGINVLVPTITGMRNPDEVRLAQLPSTGEVALVYRSRTGLPAAGDADIGMVVAMFKGRLAEAGFVKLLGPGTRVESTTVQGVRGYWIEGAPHAFAYTDASGHVETRSFRLAGNVLLWERNGLTLRIESALSRAQAVRVADSMR